jgi:DNA-binding transcriptional regulator YhcF (GntR family)
MINMSLDDRSSRIKHDSAKSVPIQVAADIEADIDSGALEPDTRLPSEAELATQYGVARVSVRRAIELLRERGKVLTFHGRGTYVAEKPGELGIRVANFTPSALFAWNCMARASPAKLPRHMKGSQMAAAWTARGRCDPGGGVSRIGLVATDGSRYLQPGTTSRAICYR